MKMHARLMKLHADWPLPWGGQSTLLFGAYSPVPVYGDDWISTGNALKSTPRVNCVIVMASLSTNSSADPVPASALNGRTDRAD